MELLAELTEKDLGIVRRDIDLHSSIRQQQTQNNNYPSLPLPSFRQKYSLRKASRAVIFREDGKIAMLFNSRQNYHKLPGGGIEENESIKEALHREALEETGRKIKIGREIGLIIEYKNKYNKHKKIQISYCYLANAVGKAEKPKFDKGELLDKFQLIWINIQEAIIILEGEISRKISDYTGNFIVIRELIFLKKANEILTKDKKEKQ